MTVTLELTREQLDVIEAALANLTGDELARATGLHRHDVRKVRGSIWMLIENARTTMAEVA